MRCTAALSSEGCCPAVVSNWDTTVHLTAGQLPAHVQTNNIHKITHEIVFVNRENMENVDFLKKEIESALIRHYSGFEETTDLIWYATKRSWTDEQPYPLFP
jgi:hypothetical protein